MANTTSSPGGNPLVTFDIASFRSQIGTQGYHKPSHFQMHIPVPRGMKAANGYFSADQIKTMDDTYRILMFDIESTSIPGMSFATDEVRKYGVGTFERKPYVPIFEEITAIIRSDAGGNNYSFFNNWMKLIINYNETSVPSNMFEVGYREDYAVDSLINIYNDQGVLIQAVTLVDFFPTYLGDVNLSWNNTSDIIKFPMRFTFSRWQSDSSKA